LKAELRTLHRRSGIVDLWKKLAGPSSRMFDKVYDRHSDNIRALILTQDFSILDKIDTQNEVSKVQSDKADNIQFIINSIKKYSKDYNFFKVLNDSCN
jgi:hypothetical protein